MSIKALREQMAAKSKEARNLLDNNTGDKWNKDVSASYDKLVVEIDGLETQIAAHEKQMTIEAQIEGGHVPDATTVPTSAASAVNDALRVYLAGGEHALSDEQREVIASARPVVQGAQSATTDAAGGYTVPTETANMVLQAQAEFGGVREVSTVRKTSGGYEINWPTVDETLVEGELVAENTAAADGDVDFGQVSIGAHKYSSKIVRVPFELLQDSNVDVVGLVSGLLGQRLGRITNRHFTVGTGTNQPNGMVTASTLGRQGAAGLTAGITYEEFVELEHSIDPFYRKDGKFMFHDDTLKAIKLLKDADDRPLWVPGLSAKAPAEIAGYGYQINQHMPVMAASAKSMLFGDLSAYMVRDVMDVSLFRFDDSAFISKGQVGFLAWSRADGNKISGGPAFKHWQNAAA